MFCPGCGANNIIGQKFCRSCGLNLEKSAESLLEQIPTAQSANLLKHEKLIEKFGNFALGGLGIVILIAVAGILYTLVQKFIVSGTNVLVGILLMSFVIFAILSLIFVLFNETLKEKKAMIKIPLTGELEERPNAAKLLEDKPFEPVPSVIEDSTDLLYAKNKTRKFE